MRLLTSFLFLLSISLQSQTACTNIDFESSSPGAYTASAAINGWSLSSQTGTVCPTTSTWAAGAGEFSIVATPIFLVPGIGTLPNSPLGGANVALLNNAISNKSVTRLTNTISVSAANNFLNYAIALYMQNGNHSCCDNPRFEIYLRDTLGLALSCHRVEMNSCSVSGFTQTPQHFYSGWQTRHFDLSAYMGSKVVLEVVARDCIYGEHYGQLYFDAKCGTAPFNNNCNCLVTNVTGYMGYCAGTSQATVAAPPGMTSYSWSGATSIPAAQASLAVLTIANPVVNNVYTVAMTTAAGCTSLAAFQLQYTSVSPGTFVTEPGCSSSAGGSATIIPNGSGVGYDLTWYNSQGVPVSTTAVLSNAAPGNYLVHIKALNANGCGSVTAAVPVTNHNYSFGFSPTLNPAICAGQSLVLQPAMSGTHNLAGSTFSWSAGPFLNSAGSSATVTPVLAPGSFSVITYSLTGTPTAIPHCSMMSTFTVQAGHAITPTISPVPLLCAGQASLTLQASPGTGTFVSPYVSSSGVLDPAIVPAGSHSFTYELSAGPCTAQDVGTFTILASPQLSVIGQTALCPGSSTSLQATGADLYQWYDGTTTAALHLNPVSSTVITVSGTLNSTGCSSVKSVSIVVHPQPVVSIVPTTTQVCAGDHFTLHAMGAQTYSWSDNSTQTVLVTSLPTGSVSLLGVDVNGCQATAFFTATPIGLPALQISDSVFCSNEPIILNATGAVSYTWNYGASFQATYTIASVSDTLVHLYGTGAQGCSNARNILVKVLDCTSLKVRDPERLIIRPNPFVDRIVIEGMPTGNIELRSANGSLIMQLKEYRGEVLDLADLDPGVYFLTVNSNGELRRQKLVKE